MQPNAGILYRLNKDDVIVHTSNSWNSFAIENDAPEIIAGKVKNRSLWDFIQDETTRRLYKDILQVVRAGKILQFNFSCDAPDRNRLMEMSVFPEINDGVQFRTRPLEIRERPPQRILDRNAGRTRGFIHICSWCKAIDVGTNEWRELEEAVSLLGLFEKARLPQLTHGICQICYRRMSEKITERKSF